MSLLSQLFNINGDKIDPINKYYEKQLENHNERITKLESIKTLYEDSSGTNSGQINLSKSVSSASSIDVTYRSSDNVYKTIRIDNPDGKTFITDIWWVANNGQNIKASKWICSDLTISFIAGIEGSLGNSSINLSATGVYITKIVGNYS